MYLSRLSGCPKSSQRDAPSSTISLLGTKSNQQVINLANTKGGRAQSLFVGPKTAWRLSRCGTSVFVQKEPVTRFTHARFNTSNSVWEPFHYTFVVHCIDSFTPRNKFFVDYAGLHTWFPKSQFFRPWRGFSDPWNGLTFSGRIVGKTPRLIVRHNLLKEVSITVCCGNQISASCSSPVFLLWSQRANKSSVFVNLQLQSFSLCPCHCSPRLLAFLAKGEGFEAAIEKSSRHCCHCDTL